MAREVRSFIIIALGVALIPWIISYAIGALINLQINCNEVNKSYAQVIPTKCE